jgi:hypothetical protein
MLRNFPPSPLVRYWQIIDRAQATHQQVVSRAWAIFQRAQQLYEVHDAKLRALWQAQEQARTRALDRAIGDGTAQRRIHDADTAGRTRLLERRTRLETSWASANERFRRVQMDADLRRSTLIERAGVIYQRRTGRELPRR